MVGDAGSRVLVTEPAFVPRTPEIRDRGATALELIALVEGEHTSAPFGKDVIELSLGPAAPLQPWRVIESAAT